MFKTEKKNLKGDSRYKKTFKKFFRNKMFKTGKERKIMRDLRQNIYIYIYIYILYIFTKDANGFWRIKKNSVLDE